VPNGSFSKCFHGEGSQDLMSESSVQNAALTGSPGVKTCGSCKETKALDNFYKNKRQKDGFDRICKSCSAEKGALYRAKHKDKIKAKAAERRDNNRDVERIRAKTRYERIKHTPEYKEKARHNYSQFVAKGGEALKERRREQRRAYRTANREKENAQNREYRRKRKEADPMYKLQMNLRCRLSKVFRLKTKPCSASRITGCTREELRAYIADKFQPGMTWDNYGHKGWHVDHIVPISAFDLSDEQQLKAACHYTNLQPLWAFDNLSKGGKIPEEYTK
jgi:hypothetical protein